jgi:arylsulfatase A-like enzyme
MSSALRYTLLTCLMIALSACGAGAGTARPAPETPTPFSTLPVTVLPRSERPNILFILVDDLDALLGTLDTMPALDRLMTAQGLTIQDFLISTPACCPSRSTMLRGQYVHNHQVYTNAAPAGGFGKFYSLQSEASTLATWLQAAGYRTAMFGKYLNGYPFPDQRTYIPPGWNEWYCPARGTPYKQFNYYLNENGTIVGYGLGQDEYLTDVLSQKADDFLRRAASDPAPFFAYLSTYAPHQPAVPAPRHAGLFADLQVPRTPSFNEADVSDKVSAIRFDPPLDPTSIENLDELYRQRVRSMQAVDEMIARLLGTLQETGQLENTYIIFVSDNGFHLGQHRMNAGKGAPYEEDIRVPFIIRGPGISAGKTLSGYLAANIDIAPTLAELAGIVPPAFVDGRSLVALWGPAPPPVEQWRQGLLIEYYGSENEASAFQLISSSIPDELLEPPDLDERLQTGPQAHFSAVRTPSYIYIEYPDGSVEVYDLQKDPYQLDNLSSTANPEWLQSLSAWLERLASCAAASCRTAEDTGVNGGVNFP